MVYIVYGFSKLVSYILWSLIGFKLFKLEAPASQVIKMGLVRWILGLVVGFVLFFMFPTNKANVQNQYFLIYIPVRILEWSLVGGSFYAKGGALGKNWKFYAWILGGALVSILTDLLSPEGWAGRFCVGRCLG